MNFAKIFILKVVIFVFLLIPAALADTIVLKNGRELKVGKTWSEGDQLYFIFHGMKAVIPQSKISRIESDPDDGEETKVHKNKPKDDLKNIGRKPAEDVRLGLSEDITQMDLNSSGAAIPAEPCSALRKDGFCDLQWERDVTSVEGLKKKQTVSDLDDVVEYVRPKDFLKIGDAALESVVYAFWRDQLYTVTVWTRGYANFTALREARSPETIPLAKGIFGLTCSAT